MADPNAAACAEMMAFAADVWDTYYGNYSAGVDTPLEALRNDLEGDWTEKLDVRGGILALRESAGGFLNVELQRGIADGVLAQWVEAAAKRPSLTDPDANWREVYDYLVANSGTVDSAEWTFGTPSAGGSNVGSMTVQRLTADEDGFNMEGWWPDTYTLECDGDALNTGREHTATWTFRGTASGPDDLPFEGAPLAYEQDGIPQHSDITTIGLSNPNFSSGTFSGTTITSLTGWTVGTAWTNFETNTTSTYYYLDTTNGGTPRSVKFVANDHFYQQFQSGYQIDNDTPYRTGVWFYRRDAMTGTFTIRLTDVTAPTSGGVSRAVTIGGLSDNAWTFIDLVATPGANNWPKGFRSEQLCLSFQVASLATGTCYVSNVVHSPYTRLGSMGQAVSGRGCLGTYIHVLAGSTQTKVADVFTWTDSEGQTAVNQKYFGPRGIQRGYLPSTTGGTETIADK